MTESKRVIYAAIVANVLIAAAKFIVSAITGSSAMLTEGIHSTVDAGNGGLLLLGEHLGARPPDSRHPYGHGREVYFWSFVVAIMIFAVGGGISIYEGILRLRHPEPITSPLWNFIVLGAAFLFEGASLVVAIRHFRGRMRPGVSPLAAIRRSKDPSDFMIVLEDSAALVGIVIAALGVAAGEWTGNSMWDGIASVAIGAVLAVVATLLAVETRGLLVGEGLLPESAAAIREIIASDAAVDRAGELLSTYLGPDTVIVNIEIAFRDELGTRRIEEAIERIEQRIRDEHPIVKRIFIAPDALDRE